MCNYVYYTIAIDYGRSSLDAKRLRLYMQPYQHIIIFSLINVISIDPQMTNAAGASVPCRWVPRNFWPRPRDRATAANRASRRVVGPHSNVPKHVTGASTFDMLSATWTFRTAPRSCSSARISA